MLASALRASELTPLPKLVSTLWRSLSICHFPERPHTLCAECGVSAGAASTSSEHQQTTDSYRNKQSDSCVETCSKIERGFSGSEVSLVRPKLARHFHSSSRQPAPFGKQQEPESRSKAQWQALASVSHEKINPCNSSLHPAVIEGVLKVIQAEKELCVQEAYTPQSSCFGCGPSHPDGLQLKSKRIPGGLEGSIVIDPKYCAFPGIVNGGIVSTILDCHGNWTAAISLMDKGCLPKPPLTLTSSMTVNYKEPTPPDTELFVRSQVTSIKESSQPGVGKSTVEVEVSLYKKPDGGGAPQLLVQATGIFKRLAALRAL